MQLQHNRWVLVIKKYMIDALEEIHLRTKDRGYDGVVEAENEVIGRWENEGKRRKIVVAMMGGGRISVGWDGVQW